jgi:hypothetical protein
VRTLITGGHWEEKWMRLPGQLYENGNMIEMDNIAETTRANFEKHGITTVLDMKMMTVTEISAIIKDKAYRVSAQTLKKLQEAAKEAREGSQDKNYYLSRYGHHTWNHEIHKCYAMSGCICIKK